jgi:hypothetical protein
MGWDAEDIRINLGRYKKIVVFDVGIHPLTDEEMLVFLISTSSLWKSALLTWVILPH